MIKIGLFCCCKCYEKANLVIFCKWQNKRWKCCGHPAIKMKSCHLQRMKEKKRIFSYYHLVLLALAVLLAFQAIERMCGPFGWIFMPHRWDFSNIHNKEILMQRIWTILNSFWLLHILMKLGSLIKWMGMLPANTEFLKRKKEKLADLNLRFILQHLLLSESWTLKYCWELKRTVKVTTEFYWKNLYGIEHGSFFDVWKGSTDETWRAGRFA